MITCDNCQCAPAALRVDQQLVCGPCAREVVDRACAPAPKYGQDERDEDRVARLVFEEQCRSATDDGADRVLLCLLAARLKSIPRSRFEAAVQRLKAQGVLEEVRRRLRITNWFRGMPGAPIPSVIAASASAA